jgi:mono/diheme cytochrome c family protein
MAVLLAPLAARSDAPKPPADLPKALEPGFKAWSTKCAACHAPERAYNAKYVEAKAIQTLVARMARKPNAAITKDDQKKIAAYLIWHAGSDHKTEPNK